MSTSAKAVGSALAASALGGAAPTARRGCPNFLFILTDDQRYDAVGCAGGWAVTPAADALAARGMRFRNGFVTLSICSPSRAACLTGRYGSSSGVTRLGQALGPGEETFASVLARHGYRTGHVGKWHLKDRPEGCGFEDVCFFTANGPDHRRAVIEHGTRTRTPGYIEDWNADRAVDFLQKTRDDARPFALWVCTQVPHMDWHPKEETLARYDPSKMPVPASARDDLAGKPPYLKTCRHRRRGAQFGYDKDENIRSHTRRYLACVTEMDAAIGRALAELDRLGLRDDTYVFWMGDNGWFLGEHGFSSKVLAYEESIRVPFIAAGPGIPAGGVDDHLVLNIDWAPTMLDLAGVARRREMHGASLAPLWREKAPPWRDRFIYEAPAAELGSMPHYAVRTGRWKYIRTLPADDSPGGFEELYDLANDPSEMKDLVGEPGAAGMLDELRADFRRWGGGRPRQA